MVTVLFFLYPFTSHSDYCDRSEWNILCCLWGAHKAVLSVTNVHIFCCLCNSALLLKLCMYWLCQRKWLIWFIFLFCKSNLFLLPFLDFSCIINLSQRFQSDTCLVCSHRLFQSLLFELTHRIAFRGGSCGSQVSVCPTCGHQHIPVSRFMPSINVQAVIVILQCSPLLFWFC